jgi:hypothetical protein
MGLVERTYIQELALLALRRLKLCCGGSLLFNAVFAVGSHWLEIRNLEKVTRDHG